MTAVLALDLATNAGFCVISDGRVAEVGSWNLGEGIPGNVVSTPSGHGIKCSRLRTALLALAARHAPIGVFVVESDINRGSGSCLLDRLQGVAHAVAMDVASIPIEVDLADWREDVHGVTGESTDVYKQLALERCADDGIDVPDADAAEAYCIARFVDDRAVFTTRPAGQRRRAA